MSYIVNLPDGTLLTTILDGTIDNTSSSLTLVGRNYSNYGEIIAEDLVALLVNFARGQSPNFPNIGQLWYDTDTRLMKVYSSGNLWKTVGAATASSVAPSTPIAGDFWWESTGKQLFVYDGTDPYNFNGWTLVGPSFNFTTGKAGAIVEKLSDGATFYNVVSLYLDGTRTAIISQTAFTPNVTVTGFSSLQVGYNMSTQGTLGTIWGTANNASYLGTQPAANYFRNNINNVGSGTLQIQNNGGLTLGAADNANISIVANTLTLWNTVNNQKIEFYATSSFARTKYLTIDGSAGTVEVRADPTTPLGIATKQYVDDQFIDTVLYGIPTANTASLGTNTTQLATTAFVFNAVDGLFPYKVYQNNSWLWVNDTGVGSANLVLDGSTVMTASSAGVSLQGIPRAPTAPIGSANTMIATTQFVSTAIQDLFSYKTYSGDSWIWFDDTGTGAANIVIDGQSVMTATSAGIQLSQVPTAPTAPAGAANTMIATTAFVANAVSPFSPQRIYQNNSWVWVSDFGIGSANIVIDGTTVLTATSSGVVLNNGALATTQGQAYNTTGNGLVATTQFVKTATQWWGGSAKFVSTSAPVLGVNDVGSNNGDFWFQYT